MSTFNIYVAGNATRLEDYAAELESIWKKLRDRRAQVRDILKADDIRRLPGTKARTMLTGQNEWKGLMFFDVDDMGYVKSGNGNSAPVLRGEAFHKAYAWARKVADLVRMGRGYGSEFVTVSFEGAYSIIDLKDHIHEGKRNVALLESLLTDLMTVDQG